MDTAHTDGAPDSPTLDFYFDFSSPYGYIASERIDDIATRHGCAINWRPFLIGVAFKQQGMVPPVTLPCKKSYYERDFVRSAMFHRVPYSHPSPFPVSSLYASRAFYALVAGQAGRARSFAQACFRAYFTGNRDIGNLDTVLSIAEESGIDRAWLTAAISSDPVKEALRQATAMALERGVFGSPFIFVGNEAFWGADRLEQIEHWLVHGPW